MKMIALMVCLTMLAIAALNRAADLMQLDMQLDASLRLQLMRDLARRLEPKVEIPSVQDPQGGKL